jgi:hypothetical protein
MKVNTKKRYEILEIENFNKKKIGHWIGVSGIQV